MSSHPWQSIVLENLKCRISRGIRRKILLEDEFNELKLQALLQKRQPETLATYLLHFIQAQIKMGSILSLEAELKSLHPGWNTMGRDATHAICPVLFSNAQQARETELRKQNPASSSTACDLLAPVVCLPDNLACAAPDFSGGDCNVNC